VTGTVSLLAAREPKLCKAIRDATRAGYACVVLDGTLIPVDRVAADQPFYSGKHCKHGMNLQVIVSPDGDILSVSGRCQARCTTRRPGGSGASWTSWRPPGWSPWPIRATREAATRRSRTGEEQAGTAEGTPAAPTRGSAHPRRKGGRPAQDLAHPAEALLLSLARRAARQGHPRVADPRGITRMERVHGLTNTSTCVRRDSGVSVRQLQATVSQGRPVTVC